MRRFGGGLFGLGLLIFAISTVTAQSPDRAGRGPERDGPPPPPPGPLFEALDKDHDGVISAEEIQSASESLKKLDKNGDGRLTEDELRPERSGLDGPPGRVRDGAAPGDRGRPGADRDGADRGASGRPPGDRAPADRGASDRPGADRRPPDRGSPPDRTAERGSRDGRRQGPADQGRDGPGGADRVGPGPGGPPSVLPPFAREGLRLTDEQRKQLDDLDADVREKLGKILTPEQKQQLEQVRSRGADGGRDAGPEGRGSGPRDQGTGRPEARGARDDGAGRPERPGRPPRE